MANLAISSGQQPAPDHRDRIIASLEEDNRDLREQVAEARRQLESQRSESVRAISELRKILSPLYQALRMTFGEIDVIVPQGENGSATAVPPQPAHKQAVWESWKRRLGGSVAKVIDALMTHGQLDTGQLAIITGLDRRTISNTCIYKLNQAQLITKNGGKFSLKDL
jgi:hypothetical protein